MSTGLNVKVGPFEAQFGKRVAIGLVLDHIGLFVRLSKLGRISLNKYGARMVLYLRLILLGENDLHHGVCIFGLGERESPGLVRPARAQLRHC